MDDSPLFRIAGRGGGFIAFSLRRAAHNRAGRISQIRDASGTQQLSYGPLGEVVREARSLVSPSTGQRPQDYVTEYLYDSFGRLQALVYPDGEALRYGYNSGGLIDSAVGVKAGVATSYLSYLGYDKFEQRVQLVSGNGVVTDYTYRAADRRLTRLTAGAAGAAPFQQLAYAYDAVGNITALDNQVPLPKPGALGGPVSQSFGYDELDRLTSASGTWQGARNEQERYTLTMAYDAIHNITHKSQTHVRVLSNGREMTQAKTTYDWAYAYTGAQPHAPTQIDGRRFSYDANGNQTGWVSEKNASRRTLVWDEENRLRSVADNGRTQRYVYDASGERVFTVGAQGETAYVNQYFTVRNGTLASKHVFIGSSRLASTLVPGVKPVAASSGNSQAQSALRQPAFNAKFDTHPGQGRLKRSAQGTANAQDIYKNPNLVDGANPPAEPPPTAPGTSTGQPEGNFRYYFHPDHLGSSSYVTDGDGKLYEHLQYFPFGETWVEQASNSWRTPYRFTGKELDEETGLYYFGARYYDPRTSVWQSVDPILEKYLPSGASDSLPGDGVFNTKNLGLFSYSYNRPMIFVDPDGNRPLTNGEMAMANQVFGKSVDYSKVGIYQKPMFKGASVVLGFANAILFGDLKADFSKASLGDRRHFIHEMAHIMQSQNGMWTTVRGMAMQTGAYLKGFLKGLLTLSNPFATAKEQVQSLYDLGGVPASAKLNDLNMEQQAEAISYDYSGGQKDKAGSARSSNEIKATLIMKNQSEADGGG